MDDETRAAFGRMDHWFELLFGEVRSNSEQLRSQGAELKAHGAELNAHGAELRAHRAELKGHRMELKTHGDRFDAVDAVLKTHGDRFDTVDAELRALRGDVNGLRNELRGGTLPS